jgi:hypothetical protein
MTFLIIRFYSKNNKQLALRDDLDKDNQFLFKTLLLLFAFFMVIFMIVFKTK